MPVLPTLGINTTENVSGDGDEEDGEDGEDGEGLGAHQVLELVKKHLSKYKQSGLDAQNFATVRCLLFVVVAAAAGGVIVVVVVVVVVVVLFFLDPDLLTV